MSTINFPEKVAEMGGIINAERLSRGLNPLYMTLDLNDCADLRAWATIFTADWRENYEYDGQYLPESSENSSESKFVGAFENAEKLGKIIIPESVRKIGGKSFSGTKLQSVKISADCEYSEHSFPEKTA